MSVLDTFHIPHRTELLGFSLTSQGAPAWQGNLLHRGSRSSTKAGRELRMPSGAREEVARGAAGPARSHGPAPRCAGASTHRCCANKQTASLATRLRTGADAGDSLRGYSTRARARQRTDSTTFLAPAARGSAHSAAALLKYLSPKSLNGAGAKHPQGTASGFIGETATQQETGPTINV